MDNIFETVSTNPKYIKKLAKDCINGKKIELFGGHGSCKTSFVEKLRNEINLQIVKHHKRQAI